MTGHRGIIQAICRRLQLPHPRGAGRIPLRRRTHKNISIKSTSLRKRVLNVKTPKFPFSNVTEGDHLKMGGPNANASRGIRQSFLQIWALGTFRNKTCFNALLPIRHLRSQYPSRLNNLSSYYAGLMRGENAKLPPGFKFAYLGSFYQIRMHSFFFRS